MKNSLFINNITLWKPSNSWVNQTGNRSKKIISSRLYTTNSPEKSPQNVPKKDVSPSKVEIFAVPILKNPIRLAYYTNSSLHTFNTSNQPIPTSFFHKLSVEYPHKLGAGWEKEFGQAKIDSWKHKLYKIGTKWTTENPRISHSESFLKQLELSPPPPTLPVEDVVIKMYQPSSYHDPLELISSDVLETMKHHRTKFYLSLALIPFTSLASILPGPNVFLLYNGWRCWSHWKCWENLKAIERLVQQGKISVVNDDRLKDILPTIPCIPSNPSSDDTQHPSTTPSDSSTTTQSNSSTPFTLAEETIQRAPSILHTDASLLHHLHRAKSQTLKEENLRATETDPL